MKLDITKKRINSLVRPDSITTSFNDFLITHVKMGQLYLFKNMKIIQKCYLILAIMTRIHCLIN